MGKPKCFKKASQEAMPFHDTPGRKPTTWKQRQRVCVLAGLRAMGAPLVGNAKPHLSAKGIGFRDLDGKVLG